MKFSPELLKATDHCQHRSFITNRYTGARIAVDCGQCDYCIHKRAQKASMLRNQLSLTGTYSLISRSNGTVPCTCSKNI